MNKYVEVVDAMLAAIREMHHVRNVSPVFISDDHDIPEALLQMRAFSTGMRDVADLWDAAADKLQEVHNAA